MKTLAIRRATAWGFVAVWLAAAVSGAQTDDPWALLQRNCSAPAAAAYVPRLKERSFTVEQARETLACLIQARTGGLPVSALTLRLEEGLAKNVPPPGLLAAVQTRLRFMLQARDMLQAANYEPVPDGPAGELLAATGLALESGLAPEDLAAILKRGNGTSALRIKSVVEAGESLHLAGVDPATTRGLMDDCLDRDLRRMEVLRAVRYTLQQRRGGMDGAHIRRTLWGGQAAMEGPHGWRGGGGENRRGGGAAGGGNGSGSFGPPAASPAANNSVGFSPVSGSGTVSGPGPVSVAPGPGPGITGTVVPSGPGPGPTGTGGPGPGANGDNGSGPNKSR